MNPVNERYRPENYPRVSPYLIVRDAEASIRFMVDVLEAVEIRRFLDGSGRIMHAEVRLGDSVIMLGEATAEWPPVPAHVHVYVPDVNATYQRALSAGAGSLKEPVRQGDEDCRGGVQDANGTSWWIATFVGQV